MNKLFKTALLLIIPGGILFAQQGANNAANGNPVMQEAQYKTHQMQEQLGLSDDQTTKAFKINLDYYTQLDNAGKNSSSDEIKNEKITEITETRNRLLNDVLTVTQAEEFKKLQAAK